ncbi:MAG: hypothetical protein VW683_09515 [Betaproteobacteria bacterium]
MSKRTKLKFKKMLKKAEFVHADLEYHEELITDAKVEFNEAFLDTISKWPRRKRVNWGLHLKGVQDERAKKLVEEAEKQRQEKLAASEAEQDTSIVKNKEVFVDGETGEEFYVNPDEIEETDIDDKQGIIKKLYRKIASETHPDKLIASGFSQGEVERKESIFKKAKEAYERDNWYTLYSVAVDLGIEVGEIDEKHIDWIEEDIKLTMGRISKMGQLFVWVWYTSDDEGKKRVMDQYFKQVYNWPPD